MGVHWNTLWRRRIPPQTHKEDTQKTPISKNLEENISKLKELFADSSDIVFHRFDAGDTKAALVYVGGQRRSASHDERRFVFAAAAANECRGI